MGASTLAFPAEVFMPSGLKAVSIASVIPKGSYNHLIQVGCKLRHRTSAIKKASILYVRQVNFSKHERNNVTNIKSV